MPLDNQIGVAMTALLTLLWILMTSPSNITAQPTDKAVNAGGMNQPLTIPYA
jgi:hypothetical protein